MPKAGDGGDRQAAPTSHSLAPLEALGLSSSAEFLLLALISLLAVIPLWISRYPQMTDLPQHAAQVALLRNLHHPGFAYAHLYRVNWFTPYLFGYLLVYALLPIVNPLVAVKIVTSLALAAFPLSTALVMRRLGVPLRWAHLTIPCLYGFAFAWGMLNYVVAAPLGMMLFWLAIEHYRKPWRTYLVLSAFSVVLFFCHALVCMFFIVVSIGYILFDADDPTHKLLRIAPFATAIPVMWFWTRHQQSSPYVERGIRFNLGLLQASGGYYSRQQHWGRIAGFMPRMLGHFPGWTTDLFGIALFALPVLAGCGISRKRNVWIPFLSCMFILLFVPDLIHGTSFVYQRFSLFVLPCFLFVLGAPWSRSSARYRFTTMVAPVLAAAAIGVASFQAWSLRHDYLAFDQTLLQMQPGQRALGMIYNNASSASIAPTFLHFSQWYSALKDGAVDPGFADFFPEIVYYIPATAPRASVHDAFDWNPQQFQWSTYHGSDYKYFIVRSQSSQESLFADATCPIALRYHSGMWWLYERGEPCCEATTQESSQ